MTKSDIQKALEWVKDRRPSFYGMVLTQDDVELLEIFNTLEQCLTNAQGWTPIDTAPKDGTWIWVYIPWKKIPKGKRFQVKEELQIRAKWVNNPEGKKGTPLSLHAEDLKEIHGGYWTFRKGGNKPLHASPTYWMPLPQPPKAQED